jgi:hypothetical protein
MLCPSVLMTYLNNVYHGLKQQEEQIAQPPAALLEISLPVHLSLVKLIWQPLYRLFILDIQPTNRLFHVRCPLSHMSTTAPNLLWLLKHKYDTSWNVLLCHIDGRGVRFSPRDNGGADLFAPQPPSFVFCLSFNNDMFFPGCLKF